jgi:hypothetical protein
MMVHFGGPKLAGVWRCFFRISPIRGYAEVFLAKQLLLIQNLDVIVVTLLNYWLHQVL